MFEVLMTFIVAVFIIYLSYICSKYIGKNMNKSSSSRYMRLTDQITIGQDRHIAIVQAGSKYLLLGVTGGQINVLAELAPDELLPLSPEIGETGDKTPDFHEIMEKLNGLRKKGR